MARSQRVPLADWFASLPSNTTGVRVRVGDGKVLEQVALVVLRSVASQVDHYAETTAPLVVDEMSELGDAATAAAEAAGWGETYRTLRMHAMDRDGRQILTWQGQSAEVARTASDDPKDAAYTMLAEAVRDSLRANERIVVQAERLLKTAGDVIEHRDQTTMAMVGELVGALRDRVEAEGEIMRASVDNVLALAESAQGDAGDDGMMAEGIAILRGVAERLGLMPAGDTIDDVLADPAKREALRAHMDEMERAAAAAKAAASEPPPASS